MRSRETSFVPSLYRVSTDTLIKLCCALLVVTVCIFCLFSAEEAMFEDVK